MTTIKQIPQRYSSPDAERGLLGCILRNPDLLNVISLPASAFTDSCRAVYEVLVEMHADGKAIDEILLLEYARQNNREIGGAVALDGFIRCVPSWHNYEQYLSILQRTNLRNDLLILCAETMGTLNESLSESGPVEILLELRNRIEAIRGSLDIRCASILDMSELERIYQQSIKDAANRTLRFEGWMPSLSPHIRGLVPGELCVIIANTGVGKSALCQNMAIHARPLPTLMFSLELPGSLMFERFMQIQHGKRGADIDFEYAKGGTLSHVELGHIYTCTKSRLSPAEIESLIELSEVKIGQRPALVIVDYIGLVRGRGKSRYEQVSDAAEQMKVIAKQTNTIIVMASQMHRLGEDDGVEPGLHAGKDSGSIENSAGLVLGAWRDPQDKSAMWVKVLKCTKGTAGAIVKCSFLGETLKIAELVDKKTAERESDEQGRFPSNE